MGKRGPKKKGDSEVVQFIRLPVALDAAVRTAAKGEGLKLAQWWREAARERLAKQQQEDGQW